MANEVGERAEFGKFLKTQSRYGTSSKVFKPLKLKCLKHVVKPDDTIQGIAVRYGVTVEQIKQANKLWTNESLFLYETVDVPIADDDDDELRNGAVSNSYSSDELVEVVLSPRCNLSQAHSPKHLFANPRLNCLDIEVGDQSVTGGSETADLNRVNVDKYFSKYDTALDKARKEVTEMEQKQRQLLQS